ncbi:hypothetical protein D3C73_922950 [compost metagenome]
MGDASSERRFGKSDLVTEITLDLVFVHDPSLFHVPPCERGKTAVESAVFQCLAVGKRASRRPGNEDRLGPGTARMSYQIIPCFRGNATDADTAETGDTGLGQRHQPLLPSFDMSGLRGKIDPLRAHLMWLQAWIGCNRWRGVTVCRDLIDNQIEHEFQLAFARGMRKCGNRFHRIRAKAERGGQTIEVRCRKDACTTAAMKQWA